MNGSLSLLYQALPEWFKAVEAQLGCENTTLDTTCGDNNGHVLPKLILALPAAFLYEAAKIIAKAEAERQHLRGLITLAGQDCHFEESGAFTGDTSANHLREVGCTHVILGHSERRSYHKETNQIVKAKAEAANKAGLTPIVCVGESLLEKNNGETLTVVKTQIMDSIPSNAEDFLLAYEPVWAIGTGLTASLEDITNVHQEIKKELPNRSPRRSVGLMYGGSVTAANCEGILGINDVDGLLVGGASLKVEDLSKIICMG